MPLRTLIGIIVLILTAAPAFSEISAEHYKHHFITQDLPENKGWGYGTPALADFDNDGDLDFAFCERMTNIYWFENQGPSWKQHVLGPIRSVQLGSTILDVDQDGWMDLLIGGVWYRNSQDPTNKPFEVYTYDDTIEHEIHDMVTADVNQDGQTDVVVTGDGDGCFWYEIPSEPKADKNWPRQTITKSVLDEDDDIHGGLFPNGVADLDQDGDPDVALTDRWYENQEQGTNWIKHELPWGKRGPWGLSSRSWIIDIDLDEDNDIVIVDCDQKESRAAWLENDGKTPPSFKVHRLPSNAPGKRGSFHSLAVFDFDGDGDMDIFTAEQEDSSILPEGAPPKWFIWENMDGKGRQFEERIIFDNKLGGHDARVGDVDGDGDLDIVSKVWNVWDDNNNEGREHAGYLECLIKNK